ncbi:hypothetical protein ABW16_02790 [Mycolicibacter heraklionensis]|uniref:Pyridoxamine 5'-phosphate oxidase putative domain-containing protein n=1 Tax=Mycolicibacter heraklionensis TaxID=512402 RepID=A0ABR5FL92_9MYCO|nr:hypothetical protein [Mycolicibacter heraklionensis]KLO31751.1 hypothetical protein ABW16_02790 [Mycolicibacter heraklionensis]
MWTDAARALAAFSEIGGVVTAADSYGYPVSVRQTSLPLDAATGEMVVVWPKGLDVVEGPANLLCHSHDEKLWHLKALRIQGSLERRGGDWIFVGSAFTPPARMAVVLWRAARSNRAAGNRYLARRGLVRPQVNWTEVKAIHRRARLGQQR